jgi:hypothetical protein
MQRIGLAVVTIVGLFAPFVVNAQQTSRVRTLGILSPYSAPPPAAFRRGPIAKKLEELDVHVHNPVRHGLRPSAADDG